RPARATVAGPVGPGHRVTLQHSTPIFDDVASAWFKEHEAVPVRWTSPLANGPATAGGPATANGSAATPEAAVREPAANEAAGSPEAPPTAEAVVTREAPAPWKAAVTSEAAVTRGASVTPKAPAASTAAGSAPLLRRQPGKALAESEPADAGKPRSLVEPASAAGSTRSAGAPATDWGAADDGWRAAEALATPVSAELTPTGLPRRQPRALLVPGAAGGAEPAEPTNAPVRSAESIRGRLASYQQGIREGRQIRQNLDQEADGSQEHQDGAEETK
ncbi:MAG: hypothetical protein ACRDSZ_17850, partial [Pseudonocardiaceae bacterium]